MSDQQTIDKHIDDLTEQANDPGYWQFVIKAAEADIARALVQIERLREAETVDVPEEPF